MPDADFEALSKSIENLGLLSPIVLFEGEVLDGWHRYQACLDTLTAIKTIEYLGDNPCAFVEAQNDNRRHLTKSQHALIAVRKAEWLPSYRPTSSNDAGIKGAVTAPLPKTNDEIAAESGVGKRLIQQAKAVETKASDIVKKAVTDGKMSLEKAYASVTEKKKSTEVSADEDSGMSDEELAESELHLFVEKEAQDRKAAFLDKLNGDEANMLTMAIKENDTLRRQYILLERRITGLTNERNQYIKKIRSLESIIRKLENGQ